MIYNNTELTLISGLFSFVITINFLIFLLPLFFINFYFLSLVSGVDPSSFACFGISAQRGTFSCWNLLTGKHYHK